MRLLIFGVSVATPVISSISASPATTSASITWSTDTTTSSQIEFGLSSVYTAITEEHDTGIRSTSHTVDLPSLLACTRYHYRVSGADDFATTASSSDQTFVTAGCTGGAAVATTTTAIIVTATGGSLIAPSLSLAIPVAFTATSSSVVFQAHQIDAATFFSVAGVPDGYSQADTSVYTLLAFADATTSLTTFAEPLTVIYTYTPEEIAGLDESSLMIYRYDGTDRIPLTGCSVDTAAHTLACITDHFSSFALFGRGVSSTPASPAATPASANGSPLLFGLVSNGHGSFIQQNISSSTKSMQTSALNATTSAAVRFTLDRTLRYRSQGSDVRELQAFLNDHGFVVATSGAGSPGHETMFFGTATKKALIRFQDTYAQYILTPLGLSKGTGIFGAATRHFIENDLYSATMGGDH